MTNTTLTKIVIFFHLWLPLTLSSARADQEVRVILNSAGWQLVGDLQLPESREPCPAVLLLNRAAGNRQVYKQLALQLAARGVASLRLGLRGHGESTNLGRFVPGESDSLAREVLIWDSDIDVFAAHRYLKTNTRIDSNKIGMVGASYSGEEMVDAGRKNGYAQAYVALSPGSFSEESIMSMGTNAIPWLFIVSRQERYLQKITTTVLNKTRSVEILLLPGDEHATGVLEKRPDIAERVAVWMARHL